MEIRNYRWLFTGVIVVVLSIFVVGVALAQDINHAQSKQNLFSDKIESGLIATFSTGPADYIVRFITQPDLTPAYQMEWNERGIFVYNTLRDAAQQSQVQAKNILDGMGLRYQTFIAGNELYVWEANLESAQSLAELPEVEYIRATQLYHIDPITQENPLNEITWVGDYLQFQIGPQQANPDSVVDWGITDTKADQFWSTFGFQGEGMLVANIDTGVQWDHPALVNQFKCSGDPSNPACWSDPSNICGGSACDNMGHGSHTMGTMVADDDPALPYTAGMAPNAQWIACKGCEYNWCSDYALNSCADWILAPGGDPNNRPNVVNNSWGGGGCSTWYLDKVNSWRAAGTFPAFSAGNGYGCNTLGSPGDYQESFGSTSHNINRDFSYFASGGPSCFGHDPYTKPNISAPGENICSTVPGGWECGYSGTSMSSPHSAGAVALLWSCNPGLVGQIEQTFEILQDNANPPEYDICGVPDDGEGNYTFGYGYLDVYASGLQWCGETGVLQGNVHAPDMTPISQAHIYTVPGPYETYTDEFGDYQMTMMVGEYDVTAEAFGYYPFTVSVEIITDTVTYQDFILEPAPSAIISGIVTDGMTGWPLYASIDIVGYPYGTIWTDPVTGYYEVSLPEGSSFEFIVSAWVMGYLPEGRPVGPIEGNAIEDFTLYADEEACVAPGYKLLPYSQDFEADNGNFATYGDGLGATSWEWGSPSPYPGPGGAHSGANVWATNLDGYYNSNENSYLESPDIDLDSMEDQEIKLSWWQWLATEWYDPVDIQVSNDGGDTWITIYGPAYGPVDFQWTQHSLVLDPTFAVGNFRIRFHIYTNEYNENPGWYVDDIIVGACQPQEGGLVVGNVYESNQGTPLTGAEVSNDSGESTFTLGTSDSAVGDSFYTLFSPAGTHVFTASYPGYNSLADPLEIQPGSTLGHDFYLPAGFLVADPTFLNVYVPMGDIQDVPLMLNNIGDGSASFEIKEADKGFIPGLVELHKPEPTDVISRSDDSEAFQQLLSSPIQVSGADVLLIQNYDAWGYPAITSILNNNAIAYDLINAWQISGWDFSPYVMIIIPSVQGWDYYNNFNSNLSKFEEFIDNGGLLLMSFCTHGESVMIPFGGSNPWDGQYNDYIVEPDHPTFSGVPNPIWGSYASHNSLSGILPDDRILMTTGSSPGGNPVLIEREQGSGLLVAGGLTYEYGWGNGQDAGLILNNMIPYYYFFGVNRDVPWLSESPITGTIPADNSQLVTVTFDASMLGQPGEYLAELTIRNDTPYGPLNIPVTMIVEPPADWGKLLGTVVSEGYCDEEWNPLEEAQVVIQSSTGMSWTLETDAGGYYSWWLDEDGNPYTVSVTYPEHQPSLATGVIIVGQGETIQDFALRWLRPCVKETPPSLETTLELGLSNTLPITLTNTGANGTDFELVERDGGWVPTSLNSVVVPAYQPAENGNSVDAYSGQQTIARDSFIYTLPADVRLSSTDIRVLLVAAYDVYQIQALLQAFPDLVVVDIYDARYGTPALDELLEYGSVVLISNSYFYDNVAMGNVLADYVDAGGTVVQTVPTFFGYGGWKLAGRFVDEGYSPFIGTGDWFSWADLSDYDAGHPIMEGVTYARDYYRQVMELAEEAEWVANWTDDEFIATKGKVVGINTALFDGYAWSGDIPLIVHNSIAWLMSGNDVSWLIEVPITGTLPADVGLQVVAVTFDSSAINQPGDYYATLNIKSDDPENSSLPVSIAMNVTPPPDWGKLTGIAESLGYCDLNPAPLSDYTVVVDVGGEPLTATLTETGSYVVWLEQGTYTVTASAEGHLPTSGVAEISGGEVTTLDFGLRWIAPCISGAPTSYNVEVPQGFSFKFPFDVVNTGAGDAGFELKDRAVKEVIFSSGKVFSSQALVPAERQQTASTEGLELPSLPEATILEAGDVLQTWTPTENNEAWGIAFDGADESVWVGQGWASPYIYEYELDGTYTGRSHDYSWGTNNGPADDAFNWNTGMLWTLDVGNGNCLHEMNPVEGYTGYTICGPWYYSQRGVAYDPSTDTWFVGGWNDYTIYHIDSNGALLDSAYVGIPISGLAYNPATLHLFVMVNSYDEPVYVLDAASNYTIMGQFYIDGWQGYYNGAGLEIDCDGTLWAVAQGENKVYQFESGETASLCEPGKDAPWLTEDPQEGVVGADSSYPIELTFTAFPTMTINSFYTGTLIIKSDDPVSDTFRVPVTMTVIAPVIEVSMLPTDITKSSPPGTVVNYVLSVQNLGNVPDVYDMSLEDQQWPVWPMNNQVSLGVGESAQVSIFVLIPSSAEDGDQDAMTVRATSQLRSYISATSQLTTVAQYQRVPRLIPPEASLIGKVGEMVEYQLTLGNFSQVADTFELTVDSDWLVNIPVKTFTLDSFETVSLIVHVFIPTSAYSGDMDIAMITVTSQSDPTATDTSRLLTYAGIGFKFMPMISK